MAKVSYLKLNIAYTTSRICLYECNVTKKRLGPRTTPFISKLWWISKNDTAFLVRFWALSGIWHPSQAPLGGGGCWPSAKKERKDGNKEGKNERTPHIDCRKQTWNPDTKLLRRLFSSFSNLVC